MITEWDSVLFGIGVHLRTVTRDGWVCTEYAPGTVHDGTEGELYSLADDPLQRVNRWDDPALRAVRDDLVADLRASRAARPHPRNSPSTPPSDPPRWVPSRVRRRGPVG